MKQNSWHFKLHKFAHTGTYRRMVYRKEQVSLCEYFWDTLFILIGVSVGVIFITMLALLCVINPIGTLFALLTGIGLDVFELEGGLMFLWIMLVVITFSGIFSALKGELKVFPKWLPVDEWFKFNKSEQKVQKEPSLIVQYIKAKKEKFCPMLKLED